MDDRSPDFWVLLQRFLAEANRHGYAAGESKNWIKEPDGSTTIDYEFGFWRYHDNFFGGEPYGGREVVFYEGKAVWMMVYYGWVEVGQDASLIYRFLREALLKQNDENLPLRGPKSYTNLDFVYRCDWSKGSTLCCFSGHEQIFNREFGLLYRAHFEGGLVDRSVAI
ncbi:MAG: hypothetical protein A2114_02415 [Candidatus Vogelbacteria bacterium GWA1_51_14]|uniref:DUF5680 domain-containing protein n=1 Tax=Candidatus Vogelbacteria bacterium GWA1_51_14 TaxID=1802435 RepID=A0A1G2QAX8_9BACT|nr:MAG: hypothetical protein A2114_02415 [Candidatus Vogelbacteria bacterium GWA1_51_14]